MNKPDKCVKCEKTACSEWEEVKRDDNTFEFNAVPCEHRDKLMEYLYKSKVDNKYLIKFTQPEAPNGQNNTLP